MITSRAAVYRRIYCQRRWRTYQGTQCTNANQFRVLLSAAAGVAVAGSGDASPGRKGCDLPVEAGGVGEEFGTGRPLTCRTAVLESGGGADLGGHGCQRRECPAASFPRRRMSASVRRCPSRQKNRPKNPLNTARRGLAPFMNSLALATTRRRSKVIPVTQQRPHSHGTLVGWRGFGEAVGFGRMRLNRLLGGCGGWEFR